MSTKKTVEIHYFTEEDQKKAKEIFEEVSAVDVFDYDGFIEGKVDEDSLDYLSVYCSDCNLLTSFPDDHLSLSKPELENDDLQKAFFPNSTQRLHRKKDIIKSINNNAKYETVQKRGKTVNFTSKLLSSFESIAKLIKHSRIFKTLDLDDSVETPHSEIGSDTFDDSPNLDISKEAYLVRLKGTMSYSQTKEFENLDVDLNPYDPPFVYSVLLNKEKIDSVKEHPYVLAVKTYGIEEKISDSIKILLENPQRKNNFHTIVLTLHSQKDLEDICRTIERSDEVELQEASGKQVKIRIRLDSSVFSALIYLPEVAKVTLLEGSNIFTDRVRHIVGINSIYKTDYSSNIWDGYGEIVAVIDSGVDKNHPDLKDNILGVKSFRGAEAEDFVGHGTHVAGIIVGTGSASQDKYKGIAPGAKVISLGIVSFDDQGSSRLEIPLDLGSLLSIVYDMGARIINLSWGQKLSGDYESGALSLDQFIYDHPDAFVVIAAGNDGEAKNGRHEFSTIGSPASSKNSITVGSCASDRIRNGITWGQKKPHKFPNPPVSQELISGNPDLPSANSSRGPTSHDSIKPDVLAPGTCIISARASRGNYSQIQDNEYYTEQSGTSMAAPVVSGCAAVLRQYLKDEKGLASPSAALMKALFIASCTQLPQIPIDSREEYFGYPDFHQGYGRINMHLFLPLEGESSGLKLIFTDIANGEENSLTSRQLSGGTHKSSNFITVKTHEEIKNPLRIVLCYTDHPGPYPQNNLNLSIQEIGGRTLEGNYTNKYKKVRSIDPFDNFNNVESIFLDDPKPDTKYIIKVFAKNTPRPNQGYALVVIGNIIL
ncbi:MAG: hypothetical protein DHS20C13_08820 [Thermodesulfobacteriota bacterium]|nr:MAG: hypothetical protein DHS20C13_08820 [Thermodesulfobacteriota bacterium]